MFLLDNSQSKGKENATMEVHTWLVSELVLYSAIRARTHAVDRMAASINQFGFKIPILARSRDEVVDGEEDYERYSRISPI